jgi:hypothetical protein
MGVCYGDSVAGIGGECCLSVEVDACGVCNGDGTGLNGCPDNCGGAGSCACDVCDCNIVPQFGDTCVCSDIVGNYHTSFGYSTITPSALTLMSVSKSLSFEGWINVQAEFGRGIPIIERLGTSGQVYTFSLGQVGVSSSLNMRIETEGSCATCAFTGTAVLATNTWYHVAFAYDHTTSQVCFYLNGVQDACGPFTPQGGGLFECNIGRSGASITGGMFDEFRMWDHARTAQQIGDNYLKSLVGYEEGLVFNHNYQQWTSSDLSSIDHSPNGLDMQHTVTTHHLVTMDRAPDREYPTDECPNDCNNVLGACTVCGLCDCGNGDFSFDCAATGGGG